MRKSCPFFPFIAGRNFLNLEEMFFRSFRGRSQGKKSYLYEEAMLFFFP